MHKICIFAGTTEGRELLHFLNGFPPHLLDITLCFATEYGELLLEPATCTVRTGRMAKEEMRDFFPNFDLIVDCTHPYAQVVTEHISSICRDLSLDYLRILRESGTFSDNSSQSSHKITYVHSMEEMTQYLEKSEGNILSTLGSKELHHFTNCNFLSRFYARVLPLAESLALCQEIALPLPQIFAMQGPFSYDLNHAMMVDHHIKIMLTKDSGKVGGYDEKLKVCQDLGVELVLLTKPTEQSGISLEEAKLYLQKRFHLQCRQHLTVLSWGVGSKSLLTPESQAILEKGEVFLGTPRLLEELNTSKPTFPLYTPEKIKEFLSEHPHYRNIVLLVTGDCGFFSAGKNVLEELGQLENVDHLLVDSCAGISSLNYLAAAAKISWDDAEIVSLHGRNRNILEIIKRNPKTFLLFGGENTVQSLCQLCLDYDLDVRLIVGANLSYPDEIITVDSPSNLIHYNFSPLSCAFVLNPHPEPDVFFGLEDKFFHREEGVPMTKAEVRAVTLSKLKLTKNAIIYDIGAGTGSVSVEMARLSPDGKVFAFEQKETALVALLENKKKFQLEHLEIITGEALTQLENRDFPPPSHVFVGGFSGNLSDLLLKIKEKQEKTLHVVINTVTLETLSEIPLLLKEAKSYEVVEVSISRGEKRGRYHMMLANNPVFVIYLEF